MPAPRDINAAVVPYKYHSRLGSPLCSSIHFSPAETSDRRSGPPAAAGRGTTRNTYARPELLGGHSRRRAMLCPAARTCLSVSPPTLSASRLNKARHTVHGGTALLSCTVSRPAMKYVQELRHEASPAGAAVCHHPRLPCRMPRCQLLVPFPGNLLRRDPCRAACRLTCPSGHQCTYLSPGPWNAPRPFGKATPGKVGCSRQRAGTITRRLPYFPLVCGRHSCMT